MSHSNTTTPKTLNTPLIITDPDPRSASVIFVANEGYGQRSHNLAGHSQTPFIGQFGESISFLASGEESSISESSSSFISKEEESSSSFISKEEGPSSPPLPPSVGSVVDCANRGACERYLKSEADRTISIN